LIPLKLTIEGLFSYKERVDIDFNHLMDAKLFGIFGSVGSGKSSILDALTLAIYGEIDRINKQENRAYNLMNLRSDSLFIELEFDVKGTRYRSVVNGKRKESSPETVVMTRKGYVFTEKWVPVEVSSFATVIGLSYENFRRTMIIPQGKFQEFLKLGDKDRVQMFKTLFYLDKYDLYDRTSRLFSKNKELIIELQAKLSQVDPGLSKKVVDAKRLANDELLKKNLSIKKDVEIIESRDRFLGTAGEVFFKLKKIKSDLQELNEKKDIFLDKRILIKKTRSFQSEFKDLLDLYRTTKKNIGETTIKKARFLEIFLDDQKKHVHLTALQKKIDSESNSLVNWEEDIHDINLLIQVSVLCQKKGPAKKRLEHVKKERLLLDGKLKSLVNKFDDAIKSKKKFLETKPTVEITNNLSQWFLEKERIESEYRQFQIKKTELISRVKEHLKNIDTNFKYQLEKDLKDESSNDSFENFISLLKTTTKKILQRISSEKKTQSKHFSDLKTKHMVDLMSEQIVIGKKCPLCKTKVEHYQHSMLDESVPIADVEKMQNQLEVYIKDEALITEIKDKIEPLEIQFKDLISEIKKIDKKMSMHQKLFEPFNEFGFVDDSMTKNNEKIETFSRQLTEIDNNVNTLITEQDALNAYIKNLEKNESEINQSSDNLITQQRTLESQLKHPLRNKNKLNASNTSDEYMITKYRELSSEKEKLEKKINAVKLEKSKTDRLFDESRLTLKEGEIKLQQVTVIFNELTIYFQKITTDMNGRLAKLNTTIKEVDEVLGLKVDIEKEEDALKVFETKFSLAEALKKDLIERSIESPYNEIEHHKIKKELTEQKEILRTNDQLMGRVVNEIEQMERDLVVKERLEKELVVVSGRKSSLSILKELFKGNRFVNYVSTQYLQQLCFESNKRFFRMTKQQLKLTVNQDNQFCVVDYLNEGKIRGITSLSGGQMFQASLALALSLSETIKTQLNYSQNFFFIDEGFGMLDQESIEIVMETLQELRNENHVVGLISHVDSLKNEIPVFLKTINDPKKGTRITKSWEEISTY
jgi:DNA repair protein SbcC/Rad50